MVEAVWLFGTMGEALVFGLENVCLSMTDLKLFTPKDVSLVKPYFKSKVLLTLE